MAASEAVNIVTAMHEVTLPIDTADGPRMDAKEACALGAPLAGDFRNAIAFAYTVIDGVLAEPLIRELLDHIPSETQRGDVVFDVGHGGQPDELLTPQSVKRRSIALYCCTASKNVCNEAPNLSTMYQARPTDTPAVQKETRGFYRARCSLTKVARSLRTR